MTASDEQGAVPGPLAGLRVIEIGNTIAGPLCARLMADFGAQVTKVEPLQGDPLRQMGRHVDGVALYAASLLRGKRSIALDLKAAEGREIVLELAARADILIENNRPGVMEDLGLGYDVLSARNPRLIMVRISGFGQSGPYAHRPGYGVICEAVGGVRHLTGDPDRPPARVALGTTDHLTAVYAAWAAAMAVIERSRSGRGQVVDAALYEAAFAQMEQHVTAYDRLGLVPKRTGPGLGTISPNSLYPTADGQWLLIAANNEATFRRLAVAMEQPGLLQDPRFASIRARSVAENVVALDRIVADWTRGRPATELQALLERAEVPSSPVYTIADIFADPHFAARDMLVRVPHPKLGQLVQSGVMPKLSETPGSIRHAGPELGADTAEVLGELGLDPGRIADLEARRVVGRDRGQDGAR
jgi:crotonobetainyl-CoA:carnitine CoA-transferase CaiB-like acyl-CoA transferase